jgi:hypothetical protein
MALIAMVLLAAIGLGLIGLTNTDALIAANVEQGQSAFYASAGALDEAIGEVMGSASWSAVLSGAAVSMFRDTTRTPTLPSGLTIDLDAITVALQASAAASWGASAPAWRLYAYGPRTIPGAAVSHWAYVAVWVSDDVADGDSDPVSDANGTIALLSRAWGAGGTRRGVVATVARAGPAGGPWTHRILTWKDAR